MTKEMLSPKQGQESTHREVGRRGVDGSRSESFHVQPEVHHPLADIEVAERVHGAYVRDPQFPLSDKDGGQFKFYLRKAREDAIESGELAEKRRKRTRRWALMAGAATAVVGASAGAVAFGPKAYQYAYQEFLSPEAKQRRDYGQQRKEQEKLAAQERKEQEAQRKKEEEKTAALEKEKSMSLGLEKSIRTPGGWAVHYLVKDPNFTYRETTFKSPVASIESLFYVEKPGDQIALEASLPQPNLAKFSASSSGSTGYHRLSRPLGVQIHEYERVLDQKKLPKLVIINGKQRQEWVLRDDVTSNPTIDNRVVVFENSDEGTLLYISITRAGKEGRFYELKLMERVPVEPK